MLLGQPGEKRGPITTLNDMSGPYGPVRHPIHTGLLFALTGTVFVRDGLRGVLCVPLAWLSCRRWVSSLKFGVESHR